MDLFQLGSFKLHSGADSRWKIECDALTDGDLAALSAMANERIGHFSATIGIERGGVRFAEAMRAYATYPEAPVLIVDDVLTTGASMETARSQQSGTDPIGLVIFARNKPPSWVTALFQMHR